MALSSCDYPRDGNDPHARRWSRFGTTPRIFLAVASMAHFEVFNLVLYGNLHVTQFETSCAWISWGKATLVGTDSDWNARGISRNFKTNVLIISSYDIDHRHPSECDYKLQML